MPALYIKDEQTEQLACELAFQRGLTKSAAVKLALVNEIAKGREGRPLREIAEELRRTSKLRPWSGVVLGKDFYDELSGDL